MIFEKAKTSKLILGAKFNDINNKEQLKIASVALERNIWFHTSLAYSQEHLDFILKLNEQTQGKVNCIVKIDVNHPIKKQTINVQVDSFLKRTKSEQIKVVQLCSNPPANTLKEEGQVFHKLKRLKEEGKIQTVYPEVYWQYSKNLSKTVDLNIFSSFIFYHSIIHREISNDFYKLLKEKSISHIALKGLGGGESFFNSQAKEEEIRRLMNMYGLDDIVKFRILYTKSINEVDGLTIGTANYEHFENLYKIVYSDEKLPDEIINEVEKLHERWWKDHGIGNGLGLHNPIGQMGLKLFFENLKDGVRAGVRGKLPSHYW